MNHYKILTVTHKHVPVEQLQSYIVREDQDSQGIAGRLKDLKQVMKLDELMYLSTCNRVTYFFTTKDEIADSFATNFFKTLNPAFEACNAVNAHLFEGQAALSHLCEVGASIDSMVVGEREIIRQLRQAYEYSNDLNLTGDDIRLAMKFVIPTAKKIYTETKISQKPVSVVSLAVQKLKALHLSADARFILIGAGETINSTATYLRDAGFHNFTIFNRTIEHAENLASKTGGSAFPLSDLPDYTGGFDVIVSSTAATREIIDADIYRRLIGDDAEKKILVDLAIPADFAPEIAANFNVQYIGVGDLRSEAQQNINSRKAEIYKAKKLIHEFVKEFQRIYLERMVEKAHSIIPVKLNEIKVKAIEEVYKKDFDKLDEASKETLHKIISYIEKKYIALTMSSSKEAFRKHH